MQRERELERVSKYRHKQFIKMHLECGTTVQNSMLEISC